MAPAAVVTTGESNGYMVHGKLECISEAREPQDADVVYATDSEKVHLHVTDSGLTQLLNSDAMLLQHQHD